MPKTKRPSSEFICNRTGFIASISTTFDRILWVLHSILQLLKQLLLTFILPLRIHVSTLLRRRISSLVVHVLSQGALKTYIMKLCSNRWFLVFDMVPFETSRIFQNQLFRLLKGYGRKLSFRHSSIGEHAELT